ncbi:uncharacterized protein [Triticum aestivum]|uniref:uncharacterized protein n=1 Tax=Triticum aestivum TaxID=4565 RepID=UPI001D00559D|nr:uncharacterized protein LOC123170857 [Triticum aestivum]
MEWVDGTTSLIEPTPAPTALPSRFAPPDLTLSSSFALTPSPSASFYHPCPCAAGDQKSSRTSSGKSSASCQAGPDPPEQSRGYAYRSSIGVRISRCPTWIATCSDISVSDLDRHMYTAGCPDPDIVIRTSGETRLSNFLLWQTTFSHLQNPDPLWPEFSWRHLVWAILQYQRAYPYIEQNKDLAKKQL